MIRSVKKKVTRFGTRAKITCLKYVGKRVYVLVLRE